MINHLSKEEKKVLQDVFSKGLEEGTLPTIIDEGDIPSEMVAVYVNEPMLKKIQKMKSHSVGHCF